MDAFWNKAALRLLCVSLFQYGAVIDATDCDAKCVMRVQDGLKNQSRSFMPSTFNLSVSVDISFTSPKTIFLACCKEHEYRKETVELDPLGNPEVEAVYARSASSRTVKLKMSGTQANATDDWTGKLYTLLSVDPDVPIFTIGSDELPLVHWLVMNIKDGNITKGEEVLSYAGPLPPDKLPHYYYYLLYEQPSELMTNNTAKFAGDACIAAKAGRCLFNVSAFTRENSLTLRGATWMISKNSPFVTFTNILAGQAASKLCSGTAGYKDPCPASHAPPSIYKPRLLVISTIVVMIMALLL